MGAGGAHPGGYPAVSPDNRRLPWNVFYSDIPPSRSRHQGGLINLMARCSASFTARRVSVWLDARRLLIGASPSAENSCTFSTRTT